MGNNGLIAFCGTKNSEAYMFKRNGRSFCVRTGDIHIGKNNFQVDETRVILYETRVILYINGQLQN